MIISREQLQALDKIHEPIQRDRLAQRIRQEFPTESQPYNAAQLDAIIKTCFETGAGLGIEHEEEVYRLCRLNFYDPAFINLPYVQKVLWLVLNNTAAPARFRLDFIDRQLLARQSELVHLNR